MSRRECLGAEEARSFVLRLQREGYEFWPKGRTKDGTELVIILRPNPKGATISRIGQKDGERRFDCVGQMEMQEDGGVLVTWAGTPINSPR